MNNIEKIKQPEGQISMVLHRGGTYNNETGKIEGGEILSQKEIKNLIVDTASVLMARRLAPNNTPNDPQVDSQYTSSIEGLKYLAVGVGLLSDPSLPYDPITNPTAPSWDLQNPPKETVADEKLVGELATGRKEFTSWGYIAKDGSPSTKPTNILKLVTTFDTGEAVGPLTEMGLFGGDATANKDSGIMFNYKTFPVWNKPADAQLTITWKLTF